MASGENESSTSTQKTHQVLAHVVESQEDEEDDGEAVASELSGKGVSIERCVLGLEHWEEKTERTEVSELNEDEKIARCFTNLEGRS